MKASQIQKACAFFLVATLWAVALPQVRACLNDTDSDSLAQEGKALPDVVRVLTGRFERNPPLFYQMRIERVTREIVAHPDRLPLYDDVSVACDHLGRDTNAITWIEKKRAKLSGTNWKSAGPNVREAWYRYYANIGTFRIHRWIKAGANRRKLREVVHARDEIARALQIKPNAHFNRERYQLAVMNWILHPFVKDGDGAESAASFADYLRETKPGGTPNLTAAAADGLAGLLVLGNAWESTDITSALAYCLYDTKRMNVAYLAHLRLQELHKQGRKSFVPTAENSDESLRDRVTDQLFNPEEVREKYRTLRNEAESWQKQRSGFMMTRLRQGHHPDTEWDFWTGFRAAAPPSLDNPSDAINAQKVAKEQAQRAKVERVKRQLAVFVWVFWIVFPPSLMLGVLGFVRRRLKVQRRTSRPE